MTDEGVLNILKTDLQICVDVYDEYLETLIIIARDAITDEGIMIDMELERDWMLVELYAAYLYRKRKGEKTEMPRMLRRLLNNRLIRQKAGGG